ncbi:uncharacterized protein LOC124938746 [Impatiens glandulifera]|uniref:uncharacterized protein LOC124938746 n=1 Tax=Impatiens glandulifera TaxID=253017 RepID=UPI001FB17D23|nr:uncharacterized protein LOC124938746 [Impatiens glandulifera]
MDPHTVTKPNLLKNLLVRLFIFCLLAIGIRFAYIVTTRGESCDSGDFCFFSSPENQNLLTGVQEKSSSAIVVSDAVLSSPEKTPNIWSTIDWKNSVDFYSSVFQDLIADGFLLPNSKSLCVETIHGEEVYALKEIGVLDSIGIYKKASKPLVIKGQGNNQPFKENTFDFIFSGNTFAGLDRSLKQGEFADEVCRTLKPEGFLVVHTLSSKDTYSFNSFIDLFNCCKFIRTRELEGTPTVREIVMKKVIGSVSVSVSSDNNECSVPDYKKQLVQKAEPLIRDEPLKPWITLKRNIKNVKYLSSMVDINFKQRYVYVDVGSRSYGSSIVSWFKKQYPKQNKTFDIYAIEADKAFHEEYKLKKGVTLLPYAAWVKNETLMFEVPGRDKERKGEGGEEERGMGRIKPVDQSSSTTTNSSLDKISGFDFANWLKMNVREKDFVVMKMDVEGTEFELIPRLFETGAICLIDEIFLECHYNRWQKCCPGERSNKYEKTYDQCLDLFTSLRQSGVMVHQWW